MLGCLETAEYLVEMGADVNHACPLQWTALLLACANRHYGVIRLLVDHGVDVNARCNNGMTPLVLLMLGNSSNEEERYKTLEYLIEKGASMEDAKEWHGRFPMYERFLKLKLRAIRYRRVRAGMEMTTSAEGLVKIIELFTHGLCEPLALQLHLVTGLPVYSIYDPNAAVMRWGIDYWHSLVKVSEDCFLSARGLHTERETMAFWAAAWKDPGLLEHAVLIPRTPVLSGTGDYEIDRCMTEMYGIAY